MLYTLEEINKDATLLPGIKLGMIAFDSCDSPAYGLQQSLDFVKGFIAHINQYHEHEFQCKDGSFPQYRGGGFDHVVAVIGAQSSSVTIQVATMLRLFKVPQISYMATSPSLSDNDRFPYFFRTVPSDVNQAHAMLEILRKFNWTYVSVVHSDNEYGLHGFETLKTLAEKYNVCFSAPQRVDKEHFQDRDYDNVLDNIVNKTEVRVMLVFMWREILTNLMDAARRHGVVTRFVWIVCDAWSSASRGSAESRDESVLEGALAVQPLSRNLGGFDDYFKTLTLGHSDLNPWFNESLVEYCRRQGSHRRAGLIRTIGVRCQPCCQIFEWKGYRQQRYLHFVRDAIYAVAHALHDLQRDVCGDNYNGVCPGMKHIDGETLKSYLGNVSFHDVGGKQFRFLNGRDGPPRYSILNFQRDDSDRRFHWKIVGNYSLDENEAPVLNIDHSLISYRGGQDFPTSACATPCAPHQVKLQ
ncbi:hypothetical protein L9F63_008837, partial [Diploptera punctata]